MSVKHNLSIEAFDKFFKSLGNDTQLMIDNAIQERYSNLWYKKYFVKADLPIAINPDQTAMFTQIGMATTQATMMLPRAPYSEPKVGTKDGFEFYTGSLGNWGFAQKFEAQERQYFAKMMEKSSIIGANVIEKAYMKKANDLIQGGYATITNLCAQLLSTGSYKSVNTIGITLEGAAKIKPTQFKKSGSKVWSEIDSPILTKMQDTEKALRDATGFQGVLTWKMDRETFGYVQKNTEINTLVSQFIQAVNTGMYGNTTPSTFTVTEQNFNRWIAESGMATGMSYIEIVEESQIIEETQRMKTVVNGWKSGSAVLSPLGIQGEIKYADVEELEWIGGTNRQMAYLEGGLLNIMNWKNEVNRAPEWRTEILSFLAPALSVFNIMMIVDTKTAD